MSSTLSTEARGALELPPKLTLETLSAQTGIPMDSLRTYLYRGRSAPAATRRLVAAALRSYAREVEATARRLEDSDSGHT